MYTVRLDPAAATTSATAARPAPRAAPQGTRPVHPAGIATRLQRRYGNRQAAAIIQAKLMVGPANDPYEREADRIAGLATGSTAHRAPAAGHRHPHHSGEHDVRGPAGGLADPAVTQAVARARGGGRAVPDGIRHRMEQVSGADLSGVRLHVNAESDQLNAALGARAFTVGADVFVRRSEYSPGSARGDALLGHELVHTVQQGATGPGRVSGPGLTAQRYRDIAVTDAEYPEIVHSDQDGVVEFPSQVEVNGSFFKPGSVKVKSPRMGGGVEIDELRANVINTPNPVLRFSDDFNLAVEADVEAKVFFATPDRVTHANKKLRGQVRLGTVPAEQLVVRVQQGNGATRTKRLHKVEPVQVPSNPYRYGKKTLKKRARGAIWSPKEIRRGLAVQTPQNCNQMAPFVTDRAGPFEQAIWARTVAPAVDRVRGRIAVRAGRAKGRAKGEAKFNRRLDNALNRPNAGPVEDYGQLIEELVDEYRRLETAEPQLMRQALQDILANRYLQPVVGSTLIATGQGTAAEMQAADPNTVFPYHYGGVVATSGRDYVTMENYARRDPQVRSSTSGGGDPLFFFKMYSTSEGRGETWHEAQDRSGDFVGVLISRETHKN
ncbi:DUF4157 domain-containing protein [Solwaraspora sp. WMMB335]|uniref:eCIS core domain-containing protein n=1 Tax=Solwaraspora sp. WMMB335 TaxID=3404118 RepID=UPI003B95DF70